MSAAFERQIRPVYDAIDSGSNKSAIAACNKLLKKYPSNDLIKALKSLALVRSHKVEESLVLCDEVLASKPTEDATLSAMTHVLRILGRHRDMVTMYEEAYKKRPTNEDLGAQTFFANVRTGNWKSAQQVASKLHKQFQDARYLYWSVMSAVLQANDPTTAENMRSVLYKLAHRLLTTLNIPYLNPDRLYLHLEIFRELRLTDEALTLLGSEAAAGICSTSLACNSLRRDIYRAGGLLEAEGEQAERVIIEKSDRNWLDFISIIDATFVGWSSAWDSDGNDGQQYLSKVAKTRDFFTRVGQMDGEKDRSAPLALLELEKRARACRLSTDSSRLVDLMEQYFRTTGNKSCCFEDLKPYLSLNDEEMVRWTGFLVSATPEILTSQADLQVFINAQKLLRHNLRPSELSLELESTRAALYAREYFNSLRFGVGLPVTELQPADDLVILASNVLVNMWQLSDCEAHLYAAAALLEFAATRSEHSFRIKLLLTRIYRLLGSPTLALEHYRSMNVKQVQNDTLSHFILARSSTFSLAAIGDLTYVTECLESSNIYLSNSQETSDFIIRAFTSEKYTQIASFIEFEDRLDNSLQRDLVKVEHVRMRLTHEPINTEIIDMELIELKFILDRYHHDNRDFEILPTYQPENQLSFNEQTMLFQKNTGLGWLWSFLKIYIRAFQQASDMNDDVEEKLLVGDKPKHSRGSPGLHRKERLAFTEGDDLQDLTQEERVFLEFTIALADWLEPYHDYLRPSTATVLADAAKSTELKAGHPLKSLDIPVQHPGANGHGKKDEEAPPVKEPPLFLTNFFGDMREKFNLARKAASVTLVIHIALLTQEALILFLIQSMRFKSPSVTKIHKLGALVQSCKEIRGKAVEVLREMSTDLLEMARAEGTSDNRKNIAGACKSLGNAELDHDFVASFAKKVTDARKKILEGIGKGIARVCTSNTQKGA